MPRRDATVLLGVIGIGVFLAGLELMITAVALPSILRDLSDITQLRHAAWIINGYLLAYIVTMPLAGRLADVWGARRMLFAGLIFFTVGSALAGAAPSLDALIGARIVQAVGGGILVPVGTAAASHLFEGHARARALGVVGALTFLGMAAGPFVGAAILSSIHPESPLAALGVVGGPLLHALDPAWRWVFYINVPLGIIGLVLAWAAAGDWDTPRRGGAVDAGGAILFSAALVGALGAISLVGAPSATGGGIDPAVAIGGLVLVAVVAGIAFVARSLRRTDPFLDPRLFLDRVFASAAIVSLLTGYAFATAIVGGALFVDRVLYGGPDDQQVALGALAGATALGALVSGLLIRGVSLRLISLGGLLAASIALVLMSRWDPTVTLVALSATLALFGLGFGLTVTPRSTAAVLAAGRSAYGAASSTVTVARMIGMAIGLAILAAFGSTVIDHLYDQVYGTPDGYKAFIPEDLRDRPLKDGLVVDALETWAAGEAASVMVGLFLVAAGVTVAAIPAALALEARTRILSDEPAPSGSSDGPARREGVDGIDEEPSAIAL
ncbi:MAG TPA: MFS transporter [Candidatus Binatia bacterium]|nr:MFS transporter [Candidatus Binatia bacterium]